MAILPATVPVPATIPPPLEGLKGRNVLVAGAARSGLAAAELLLREGAKVWIYDCSQDVLAKLPKEIANEIKGTATGPEQFPGKINLSIISPGIAAKGPVFDFFKNQNIPWYSELELGASFCTRPLVAVTGTNGKTTVTTMIDHVLQGSGLPSHTAGNVGYPICRLVLDGLHDGPVPAVLEISSFQLESSYRFHPHVALITNLAPDHLDRYDSVNAYYETKTLIAANQTANDDLWVGPGVLDIIYPVTESALLTFGDVDDSPDDLAWNGRAIVDKRDAWPEEYDWPFGKKLLPQHRLNAMAALAVVISSGLAVRQALTLLESYKPKPHRLEYLQDVNGVACYNDSKATNVHAVCAALDSLPGPVRLVAGGRHKGDDLKPLTDRLANKVAGVYLIGEAAKLMADTWLDIVPIRISQNIEKAVNDALTDAQPGEQLLLSPACTSWDQFPSYEVRGDAFRDAVAGFGKKSSSKSKEDKS